MALETERAEVLKLVESRRITPEEGAQLLGVLDQRSRAVTAAPPTPPPGSGPGRWFKLAAQEPSGENVQLTLPLAAIPLFLRLAERWVPEQHRPTLQALAEAVQTDLRGEILRVEEPGGQRVRIWIE